MSQFHDAISAEVIGELAEILGTGGDLQTPDAGELAAALAGGVVAYAVKMCHPAVEGAVFIAVLASGEFTDIVDWRGPDDGATP